MTRFYVMFRILTIGTKNVSFVTNTHLNKLLQSIPELRFLTNLGTNLDLDLFVRFK